MSRTTLNRFAAFAAAGTLALALSACGGNDNATTSPPTSTGSPAPTESAAADAQFGPACANVPRDASDPGSFAGMAKDPVATAASNNKDLSTLVTAVKEAGLVDTLNSAQNITVFAPSNDAFAKIPEADLKKVLADKALLTKILTYHVVGQRISPDQLGTAGPYTTLQKGMLPVTGSGTEFEVGPQKAKIMCGNIQTANATVYIIDTVMMPPA
ncbi:MAG TPA: fasciclin domain-containing protein [Cryptosporangiaceae bacterium]|nr:fasciclin domain-containing protein [Cryptosporangiaceae bacterium]